VNEPQQAPASEQEEEPKRNKWRIYGVANMWCGKCGKPVVVTKRKKVGYVVECHTCAIVAHCPVMEADVLIIPPNELDGCDPVS
jgi:hypothetical protein